MSYLWIIESKWGNRYWEPVLGFAYDTPGYIPGVYTTKGAAKRAATRMHNQNSYNFKIDEEGKIVFKPVVRYRVKKYNREEG